MNTFTCLNCHRKIIEGGLIGTKNRNHCPFCLWSLHVDQNISGDRLSKCKSKMEPIGLTFKHKGIDKYGKPKIGELMIIHLCEKGDKISINRIAADDDSNEIIKILEQSKKLSYEVINKLAKQNIDLISISDKDKVLEQLYGKN